MTRPRRTIRVSLLAVALTGVPALASQPGTPPDRRARVDAPDRESLTERLAADLERIDAMRARILDMQSKIEAGANPEDLIDPETERWLLSRAPRLDRSLDRPEGRPGFRQDGGPQDGPEDGSRGRPGADEPVDTDEVRSLINEHIPRMAERLREAEATDPEAAERFLTRIAPRFRDILVLKREAPELVEVRLDEMRTGMAIVAAARDLRRLREADDATPGSGAIPAKRDEIRGLLARQFDLRQTLERHRLSQMAQDLKAANEKLDARQAEKDTIIDGHLERVLSRSFEPGPGDRRPRDGLGRPGPDGPRGDRRDRPKPRD